MTLPSPNTSYPVRALYYATMLAQGSDGGLPQERAHLLRLLSEVVACCRSREAQQLCRSYAAALAAGDAGGAIDAARRLASGEHAPARRPARVEMPRPLSAA